MMKKITYCSALGLVALALLQDYAAAETYKVVRDFSYLNPGGVWAYGNGVTGTSFKVLTPIIDKCGASTPVDCFREGNSVLYINTSGAPFVDPGSGTVLVGDNVLMMHPDSGVDAIVRFTAPRAGDYTIRGSYTIMDRSPTGIAPKIFINKKDVTRAAFKSKVDVVLTGPGANLDTKKPGGRKAFTLTAHLFKGQPVYVGVNDAGNWTFDSTALVLEVQIGDP